LHIFKELAEVLPQGIKQRTEDGGSLIEELFHKCLFEVPSAAFHGSLAPPKCKTKASRTAAFALLVELLKGMCQPLEDSSFMSRARLNHTVLCVCVWCVLCR
jgi:hypothetical protein